MPAGGVDMFESWQSEGAGNAKAVEGRREISWYVIIERRAPVVLM